jgi:hypothetical protein
MESPRLPSFTSIIPLAILLAGFGWGGLAILIFLTPPQLGPRWLFFFFTVIAFTGTTMPLVLLINKRFPPAPPMDQNLILRQSLWVGIYMSTLAWLQLGRVLNPVIAFVLAVAMVLVESLIRIRERSRWKPNDPE